MLGKRALDLRVAVGPTQPTHGIISPELRDPGHDQRAVPVRLELRAVEVPEKRPQKCRNRHGRGIVARRGAQACLTGFRPSSIVLGVDQKRHFCGCSSVVERQLPKLNVVGSTPITRSSYKPRRSKELRRGALLAES